MKKTVLSITLLCLSLISLQAQEVEITSTFRFTDGLYYSFEDVQKNTPATDWEDVDASYFVNPRSLLTQVEYINNKDQVVPMDSLWGIAIDGVLYKRIAADSIDKPLPSFAALRISGKLCYYNYEVTYTRPVEIEAYNPLTGKVFRRGNVKRDYTVLKEFVLDFPSGKIYPFQLQVIKELMQHDRQILETLKRVRPEDEGVEDKLFNAILNYNKRHPVFVNN